MISLVEPFVSSLLLVFAWIVTGPVFRFSDTWQLVINTITNVVTFVMVFLIQRARNKDSLAMQIKLSELLAVLRGADDRIVAVEELSEEELRHLHARYLQLARRGEGPLPGRMFFTRADDRITPSDKPEVRFMETPAGVPPAIKSWWYPLNLEGREFIYPKEQARRLAKNVTEPVLTTQAATTNTEQTNTADLARISSNGQETKVSGKAAAANPKGKSQEGTRAPASISVSNPSVPPEQHSR